MGVKIPLLFLGNKRWIPSLSSPGRSLLLALSGPTSMLTISGIGLIDWGLANVCWLAIDAYRGIYAQSALYAVFIGFNVYGWITWGKK